MTKRICLTVLAWCLCSSLLWAQQAAVPLPGAAQKSITVVLDDDYPPYVFRDEHGDFQGILIDTWALWQSKTGVAVNLRSLPWQAALDMIQAGRAEVIDPIFQTPQRQAIYDFTPPYASIEVPLFFHKSVSGIVNAHTVKGFRVGVKAGDACIEALSAQGVSSFSTYPSYSAVLQAAKLGELRVFCMDKPPALYLLHQLGINQDYLYTESLFTGAFHRAVRKGDSTTLALVAGGFANISPEEATRIQEKWFGATVPEPDLAMHLYQARYALLGMALLAAGFVLWSLMLRRRVRQKTQTLSDTLAALEQAKQSSDAALKRLNNIASNLPGMVYQYLLRPDGSSCFPYASEAIRDIYRVSPEQVKEDAAPVFAMGYPEDLPGVIASIQASAANLTPWQREFRVKDDDGTVRWLFGNALPERLADGSVLWHGFITDVTERKLATDQLRQLACAVEQAPLAVVITDLQGAIQYVSPQFSQVTGYSADEVLGRNPRILQSGQTPSATYQSMWGALQAGQVWQGELYNRKKDGALFIEDAVIAPVLDEQGQATHYVALKQDITQRKHAQALLADSLKDKTALLHEVHHRVKNNLQVIASLLRLEMRRHANASVTSVLADMGGRVQAMALLHETLYRAGQFGSVDLATYLRPLATQLFRAQSSGAAVQLVLDLAPCQVVMDQATTCGLLVNELMSNALKHAFPPGRSGSVTLRLQPGLQPETWTLSVADDGVGLPADFEQRRNQSLGLQLAGDMARQLGAELAVQPGAGACFSVTFGIQILAAVRA